MQESPQIRRIRETDADAVVQLWDRMGREVRDGDCDVVEHAAEATVGPCPTP